MGRVYHLCFERLESCTRANKGFILPILFVLIKDPEVGIVDYKSFWCSSYSSLCYMLLLAAFYLCTGPYSWLLFTICSYNNESGVTSTWSTHSTYDPLLLLNSLRMATWCQNMWESVHNMKCVLWYVFYCILISAFCSLKYR